MRFLVFAMLVSVNSHAAGWAAVATPPLPEHAVYFAVASVEKRVLAVGGYGVFFRSEDSGATWTKAAAPVDLSWTDLRAISVDGASVWVVGASNKLLHSADGGVTFAVRPTNDSVSSYSCVWSRGKFVIAAGENGDVARSDDEGLHWETERSHWPELWSVWGSDAEHLWGAGKDTLQFSSDRGRSWKPVALPAKQGAHNVIGVASELYVANGSHILHSDDNGKRWSATPMPKAAAVGHLRVKSADEVWVAGFSVSEELMKHKLTPGGMPGILMVTRDHGKSWSYDGPQQYDACRGITTTPDGARVAVCGSIVLRYAP
jgi:photosystem II stability/assembly factor-like uncharacterized protein